MSISLGKDIRNQSGVEQGVPDARLCNPLDLLVQSIDEDFRQPPPTA